MSLTKLLIYLTFIFLFVTPVMAQDEAEPVSTLDEITQYWIDWAEIQGYSVLDIQTATAAVEEMVPFTFNLEPGHYHIYAESRSFDDDIDLVVFDSEQNELAKDTKPDNYPVCNFVLETAQQIEIQVTVFSAADEVSLDFVIILAREDGAVSENSE